MAEARKLHISWELRRPLFLIDKSCHVLLSSKNYQTGKQQEEALHLALRSLSEAFETRDMSSLYRCTVGLARNNGSIDRVTIVSANSQLHALNSDAEAFKLGYELDIAAMIDTFVGNEGTFVDVGANFGYFPIYLAARASFNGSIHAFEPSTRGYTDLTNMVSGFGLDAKIRCYKCALGNNVGRVEMFFSNSDGLTTIVSAMANRLEKVVATKTVEMRKLDEFDIPRIDLIKIDVEGAESLVLAGAVRSIRTHTPVVIFESWNIVDDSAAFDTLEACGYQFFVPTWTDKAGQMNTSVANAADPTKLVLVMFQATERQNLPRHFNVVAIHSDKAAQLFRAGPR